MKTVKLGDVCDFKPAKSLVKTKITDDTMVSFSPMEQLPIGKKYFTPEQSKKLTEVYSSYVYFEDNDVIYAKITPCFENGKMSIAKGLKNGVGFGSSEFVPIRCSDKILPEYLYYFLLKPSFIEYGSQNMRGASGHKRVPDEITIELLIPLPSLEEQRRVVERLDAAFEKIDRAIELTEKNITETNLMKSSLLTNAFNVSYSKTVKLGDLFTICSSKRVLKSEWQASGIPFYRGREITRLSTTGFVANELFIDENLYSEYAIKYGVPRADDIMITAIGTIGNTYIVKPNDKFYFKDASVLWLKNTSRANVKFINYWFKSNAFRQQLESNGTTVDTLTISKLQSLELYAPSLEEQRQVVERLDAAFEKIDATLELRNKKLMKLKELRQSALTQAFSGSGVE